MQFAGLDDHVRLSVELALTGSRTDPAMRQRQDAEARRLGMSGAEIDAAREGRSFDLLRARAIALALAQGDHERLREDVRKAGLDEYACRAIEELARSFLNDVAFTGGRDA